MAGDNVKAVQRGGDFAFVSGQFSIFYLLFIISAAVATPAETQTQIEATADNSIVLVEGEFGLNAGSQNRIRIKGNQHLVAIDFDFDKLRGKRIRSAALVCQRADENIDAVTISTIAAPWDEHKSSALTSGKQGYEGWGWPGGLFPAVTGGNSFSLVCQAKSVIKEGAYYWEIEPDLLHANIIDAAYGMTIHEVSCDYSRNPRIFSHEERDKCPYIVVTLGGDEPAPEPASELRITHRGDVESMRLQLRAPKNGFAYEVYINSAPLPRWNIPFVKPGEIQIISIRDISLKPGENIEIKVITTNRVGQKSESVTISSKAPSPRAIEFPKIAPIQSAGAERSNIAVIPVLDKYDINGKAVGELAEDYLRRNEVYDGEKITLAAAKGEVVDFQVLLKGEGKVKAQCELGDIRTQMRRAIYVQSERGLIADPLVPFEELELDAEKTAAVCVDVFVPFECDKKIIKGAFSVSDGRRIPIELRVRNFAIPREASFLCEMNTYGMPDRVSEFYQLAQIAYDHRVHSNILHYSHRTAAPGARKCNLDMMMADGRRMNERRYNDIMPGAKQAYWDDFISVFGPYLSGAYFKDGHRGQVPAPGFYLTFHESWPLNVRTYFNGNPDAYEAFKEKPEYCQTFVDIVRDFISVAKKNGWTQTGFQLYLNNKGSLEDRAKSPWVLDEPAEYWDYRALAYYGDLVQQAKSGTCPIRLQYRIDISRPQFDRGQLFDKADLWVVSTDAMRQYQRIIADRVELTGENIWVYGTSTRVEESNRQIQAWALWAYRNGAKGLVPWQTVDKSGKAMKKADQLALFIFDRSQNGDVEIHPSMRLKSYRRAEQDIEYLELLRKKLNVTDGQLRSFIDNYLNPSGNVVKKSDADAGTAVYRQVPPEAFRQLREAAAKLLEGLRL